MTVSIRVTHPSGKIDPAKYWLGFLVAHEEYADTGKVYAVDSVEIVSLNLSFVEARRVSGGFSFPLALRNDEKNRTDPSTVAAYYVRIEDLASAFDRFRFVKYVEFVVLRRDGGQLQSLGSGAAVHFHTDSGVVRAEIGDAESRYACIHRVFARRDDSGAWTLKIGDAWVPQPNFRGEITALCAKVRDELEQQRRTAVVATLPQTVSEAIPRQQDQHEQHGESAGPIAPPESKGADPVVDAQEGPGKGVGSEPGDDVVRERPVVPVPAGGSDWNWGMTAVGVAVVLGIIWYFGSGTTPATVVAGGDDAVVKTPAKGSPTPSPSPPAPAPPKVSPPAPAPVPEPPPPAPVPPASPPTPVEPPKPQYPIRTRDEVGQYGFDDHMKRVVQVLKANGSGAEAAYADGMAWLEANKQPPLLDPEGVASRRTFNDDAERRIVAARNVSDPTARNELVKVAEESTEFLTRNFGSSRAQLNLALTYVLLNQPRAALPPAFHAIVYNPMGGNGWVALGMGLAQGGDRDGGAQGLCVALKIARYSDKTVSLMQRLEAGLEYNFPRVRQAAHDTRTVCPSAKWN